MRQNDLAFEVRDYLKGHPNAAVINLGCGLDDAALAAWDELRRFKPVVAKKLEEKRAEKAIGSSLAAEVDIHAEGALFEALSRLGDDLRFALITSRATLHRRGGEPEVVVAPSAHAKCERCWHYRADVGANAEHATLCGRCADNLFGTGETRTHA